MIPTRRRETRLAFALDALADQTLAAERFEVIVVRSSDTEGEPATGSPPGLPVRFIASPVAGTSAQRNCGWRAARGPVVAFTDDDCRPAPGWLQGLLDAGAGAEVIVQGRTVPDPDERHLFRGLARTILNVRPSGWYETCNIAYARASIERLGGFDEAIDFLGEDVDLGLRARRAGVGLRFTDRALVWHAVHWRSVPAALRDARKRGSRPAIVARYPELRERLWLGVFTDRDHAWLLLAATGLGLLRRVPSLGVLAALPYAYRHFVRSYLKPWDLVRYPGNLAAGALVDATEIVWFTVSSVRSRAVVL
ncbi:MAG: glycosyltransferase [Actinomycetota bacterium]|nr:glycosyltransferase [Actinomycetota bacterium]